MWSGLAVFRAFDKRNFQNETKDKIRFDQSTKRQNSSLLCSPIRIERGRNCRLNACECLMALEIAEKFS